MTFEIDQPTTVYFRNHSGMIKIYFSDGELYHLQATPQRLVYVKFPDNGVYVSNCDIDGAVPGIKKPEKFDLPQQDRWNPKSSFHVVYNPNLKEGPARIYYEKGLCEVGPIYEGLPYQFKKFVLLHEQGHLFYSDEQKADLYALNYFMQDGYNASQAYYALENVLKHSKENIARTQAIFQRAANLYN